MSKLLWKLIAVLAVFGLLAGACGDDDGDDATPEPAPAAAPDEPVEEPMAEEEVMAEEEMAEEEMAEEEMAEEEIMSEEEMASAELGDITTVKLVINPWNGSGLNVEVARQLLENELGYTVETIDLDENVQWAAINTGDQHASLEVWPSGHGGNIADFIENPNGNVANAGLLGVVGKIGWYLPTYMVDEHPALATWEGLADPELAMLFATAETGDSGQLLAGDPSYVAYEQEIIDNLGLNFELVSTGSEEGLVSAIDTATSRGDPLLLYFWTPHSIHAAYDLTRLELPEYTAECEAAAAEATGGYECDYPDDNLLKIVWSGLEEGAPAAWEFLHNFNYTTDDQVTMLAAVESDGESIEDAAAAWIAANEATWSAWIPS